MVRPYPLYLVLRSGQSWHDTSKVGLGAVQLSFCKYNGLWALARVLEDLKQVQNG